MPRHRLGVVLLLPDEASAEIDVLRRALGDTLADRVPPHITLVPPVNVRADRLNDAIALVREAAAEERKPVRLHLGPIATFAPVNPVLFLAVDGDTDSVRRLRESVFHPPLERTVDLAFVPHVTLADHADETTIAGAMAALGRYEIDVLIDSVTVLEEGDDRVWRPIAEARLGDRDAPPSPGLPAVTSNS